ncbi:MAG TPA: class E sortase [Candidatus Saccharibacteria bacterium]|nr:class E sortase [Candidatus Saccharibacteria bacterium]
MRYTYHAGFEKRHRRWLPVLFAGLLFLGGAYIMIVSLAPALPDWTTDTQATANKLVVSQPTVGENRLYIPQINVDVATVEVTGSETAALDKGAIHRAPTSGNPKDGGNYVLAAHRFTMGLTPQQTRLKSPFYHIDKVAVGDQIYVDYDGTRYAYKVTEKRLVEPNEVSIEAKTSVSRLTLYSCTLSGARDGREVVIAEPIGTVTWSDGQPKVKSL